MSSLMDFILKNRHFLETFSNGLDREIINSLRRSQVEILKKLEAKPWINEISRSHYKYVLAQTIDILKQVHEEIDEKILDSLGDVARLEYFNVANAILKQEGLDLISRSVPNLGLPAKALKRLLKPKIGDFLLSDLFNKSFKNHLKNSKRALLNGLIQGHSMQTMAKNIKTATNLSIIESTRIARTSVMDVSNKSLQEVYKSYEDFIIAYRWIATLDHRTCLLCGHFDGQVHTDIVTFGITPPAHFLCFTDPKVKIYTSKGWRPIGEIKVGDLVLTHKARFRKVTELIITPNQKPFVVNIKVKNPKWDNFTVTEDHPVMINGEWKAAKEAKNGDKIKYISIDKCKRCGKPIPYGRKYCSRRCLSLDITDRQWSSPEHRKNMSIKTSNQLKREYELGIRDKKKIVQQAHKKVKELREKGLFDPNLPSGDNHPSKRLETRKKISESHKGSKNPMHRSKHSKEYWNNVSKKTKKYYINNPEKHPNYILAKNGHKTLIEKIMERALLKENIKFEYNYNVGSKWVDFAIIDQKIAIECDGEYWHQDEEKDKKRDLYLNGLGWLVLRFKEKDIKKNIDMCILEIKNILKNHNDEFDFVELEIDKVKRWKIKNKTKLFNFSVEEDESYVAKGFLVHNCRCILMALTEYDLEGIERPYKEIVSKRVTRTGKVKYETRYGKTEASEKYRDWFERQNELFKKEVLQPNRYAAYKKGELNFEKFSDIKTGRVLTIDQLSEKYDINFKEL